ncbi:MAG: class I SAM-dependent methyltransferase [Burkholderiales bacterium]|nr:MAG: class I SAM-dependent methyltransferase [Burkholderiales bacterium]
MPTHRPRGDSNPIIDNLYSRQSRNFVEDFGKFLARVWNITHAVVDASLYNHKSPLETPRQTAPASIIFKEKLMSNKIKQQIKNDWSEAPYYDLVESDSAMRYFWGNPIFDDLFEKLDLSKVAELACGHGRHSDWIAKHHDLGSLVLVDINKSNIDYCVERFKSTPNVKFIVNEGSDLKGIPDNSLTALFCYDAMVHFEFDDVFSYLIEIYRCLTPNGMALLHHSNNDKQPGNLYSQNIHWRNYMSASLFKHMAIRAGLRVLEQRVFDWGDAKDLDCVTLLQK